MNENNERKERRKKNIGCDNMHILFQGNETKWPILELCLYPLTLNNNSYSYLRSLL